MSAVNHWHEICRICLNEEILFSIFDHKNDDGTTICEKIMECFNIEIKRGLNLPEQICKACYDDLNIAFRFHNNCKRSEDILQTFLQENDPVSTKQDTVIKLEKRKTHDETIQYLPIKIEPSVKSEINEYVIPEHVESDNDDNEELFIDNNSNLPSEEDTKVKIVSLRTEKSKINSESKKSIHKNVVKKEKNNSDTEIIGVKVRKSKKSGGKPLKICEICGNTYKYSHAFDSHMRRHKNEKPFTCEICNRAFVINFELRRHMRTHTGQKPYACQYCDRRFSDFGSRIKHERTHTGERPYCCETCGKSFSYSHVLQSHIRTHTGEKPYVCTICQRRFTKGHHLKAHMNTHNKNKTVKNAKRDTHMVIAEPSKMQTIILTPTASTLITDVDQKPITTIWTDNPNEINIIDEKVFNYPDEDTKTVVFIKEKKHSFENSIANNYI